MTTATPEGLRKRPGRAPATNGETKPASPGTSAAAKKKKKHSAFPYFGIIDVLRAVTGIALLSTLGSYLVTRGTSYIWGYKRPWWTYPVRLHQYWTGPIELTLEELAKYDGSTPGTHIYLAINRTIYDMTSSPQVYGPGGAYSKLAAKDASRSFITTCFDPVDDLVPYLGGVEEVFVPLWLSKKPSKEEIHRAAGGNADAPVMGDKSFEDMMDMMKQRLGRRKYKKMQEDAYEKAMGKVKDKIAMWESMFQKKEYPVVGRVVGVDESDPSKWKKLKFCEEAQNQRPPMTESLGKAAQDIGGDGKINLMMGRKAEPEDETDDKDLPEPMKKRKKKKLVKKKKKVEELKQAKYEDMMLGGKWGGEGDAWWFDPQHQINPDKGGASAEGGEKKVEDKTEQEVNNEI